MNDTERLHWLRNRLDTTTNPTEADCLRWVLGLLTEEHHDDPGRGPRLTHERLQRIVLDEFGKTGPIPRAVATRRALALTAQFMNVLLAAIEEWPTDPWVDEADEAAAVRTRRYYSPKPEEPFVHRPPVSEGGDTNPPTAG